MKKIAINEITDKIKLNSKSHLILELFRFCKKNKVTPDLLKEAYERYKKR